MKGRNALVMPVFSLAAQCVFSQQNKIKTATKSRLKLDNDTVSQQTREPNTATGCNIHRLTRAACEMMVCAPEKIEVPMTSPLETHCLIATIQPQSWSVGVKSLISRMLLPWESLTAHKLAVQGGWTVPR